MTASSYIITLKSSYGIACCTLQTGEIEGILHKLTHFLLSASRSWRWPCKEKDLRKQSYLLQFKKCIFTSEVADSAPARSPHPPPQGEPPKLVGASTTSPDQATIDMSSGTHWPQNSAAKHSLDSAEVLNHAADGYQGVEVLLETWLTTKDC